MTRVKVCGITGLEDAELAVEPGAWAIGLIFHAPSPRAADRAPRRSARASSASAGGDGRVREPSARRGRGRRGRSRCRSSSCTATRARRTAARRPPHGRKVMKAVRVRDAALPACSPSHVDLHLLEPTYPERHGGTGEDFDWELAAAPRRPVRALRRPDARERGRGDRSRTRSPSTPPAAPRPGPGARTRRRWPSSSRGRRRAASAAGRGARRAAVERRFGPYGGRYVPETLVPALDELEAAWHEARADPAFQPELGDLLRDYVGRPYAALPRRSDLGARRPPPVPQARGPDAHRRAQDQQRARPGAARQADGQAAHHRRDRRRPARRGHRHRVRAPRPPVRRLHGQGGHAPPGAERLAHAAPRRGGRGVEAAAGR